MQISLGENGLNPTNVSPSCLTCIDKKLFFPSLPAFSTMLCFFQSCTTDGQNLNYYFGYALDYFFFFFFAGVLKADKNGHIFGHIFVANLATLHSPAKVYVLLHNYASRRSCFISDLLPGNVSTSK